MTRRQRATGAALGVLVAAAVVVGLSTNRAGSACPQPCAAPAILSGAWHPYTDDAHGFAIRYPGDFVPEVPGDGLVSPGAVVTFVPTFDPSIGRDGARTNLYEVKVTVAVAGSTVSCPQQEPPYATLQAGSAFPDIRIIEGRAFAVTCSADAGAGSFYEIVTYSAEWGEVRYRISLFFHYGNLGCYPEGAVTAFDPGPFLEVLDSMASTFQTFPPLANSGSDDPRRAIVHFILSADTTHKSVDVAACRLGESETDILCALTRRTQEDSQACVRVLLCQQDDGDEAAIAALLLAGGVQVWITASPIRQAFAIGGDTVLAGSMDWSSESLDDAANQLVLMAGTVTADGYRMEFARLLETAVTCTPRAGPEDASGLALLTLPPP